ncbi:MAG TPA: TldD/PmbA family protein [Candidatus Acidoferrales bacterium]|nr:TldD/PmbA family protein [Candidatus Acidoferrales bacterium]
MSKKKKSRTAHRASAKSRRAGHISAAGHRLGASALHRITEKIIKFSEADETEVDVTAVTSALTRFANNTIHQNVAEQGLTISVRAVVDGRTARASTNKTDDESLRRVARAALDLARVQPRNPDLLPILGSQKIQKVNRFIEATANATPADRARAVARVCQMSDKNKQTTAGIFSTGLSEIALANSRGLFEFYEDTRAEFSVTMLEKDSSGWAKATSARVGDIDSEALAQRASEKCAASRSPREIPPGRYTAILEPPAVLDLVGFLFYDFAGTCVADQRSCFTGRMGKKLFGENISIWDDVYHPLQLGPPFDGEGVPRKKVTLVEKGIPKNLVYSRATAKKMKAQPTGHGFSLPTEDGEAPFNLVFAGGNTPAEEMVRSTERGLLITRLWYIREVDPYQKVLTGMTRDGTFLVENGRVTGAVRNFRFNQSIIEMLSNVEMLGPSVRASGEESFDMVVPAMKVRDFHFTEVTKF